MEEVIKLEVGTHNKIVIEKLYGPACVKDLVIAWDGYDWNVRTKIDKLRKELREWKKKKLYCLGADFSLKEGATKVYMDKDGVLYI